MATSSLRRQVKNIVHNYSDAEVKVREATSNDPWGPSATLMSEIAQMTYSADTYHEVMIMVWRRLNDNGKNWRHVYKGLTLLDYLIKNGSNKVVQECNENIIAIQTLKDFQFLDRDGKDQGINVREKAKHMVSLLKNEERLKEERAQAQTTRRKMSQMTSAIDSSHRLRYNEASNCATLSPDMEEARPQSTGEEELQLQLAIAMSKDEAEKKKEPSAPDPEEELQLQVALSQSKEEYEREMRSHQGEISIIGKALMETHLTEQAEQEIVKSKETHMEDLIDIFGPPQSSSADAWDSHSVPSLTANPLFPAWGPASQHSNTNTSSLPWDTVPHATQLKSEPASQSIIFGYESPSGWEEPQAARSLPSDPWEIKKKGSNDVLYDILSPPSPARDAQSPSSIKTENSFDLDLFGEAIPSTKPATDSPDLKAEELLPDPNAKPRSNTPESFLEPAARSLVNLDSLFGHSYAIKNKNPFVSGPAATSTINPFGDQKQSLNQMRTASPVPAALSGAASLPNLSFMPVMDTGMNPLGSLAPLPAFQLPNTSTPLPMPLPSFPAAIPLHPAMAYPYAPAFNLLPAPMPQPVQPSPGPNTSQAGPNPFL